MFRAGDFTSMSCNYIKWKQETVNKVRIKETNLRNCLTFSALFESKYVNHCMRPGSVLPNLWRTFEKFVQKCSKIRRFQKSVLTQADEVEFLSPNSSFMMRFIWGSVPFFGILKINEESSRIRIRIRIVRGTDPGIRIQFRIRTKISRIPNNWLQVIWTAGSGTGMQPFFLSHYDTKKDPYLWLIIRIRIQEAKNMWLRWLRIRIRIRNTVCAGDLDSGERGRDAALLCVALRHRGEGDPGSRHTRRRQEQVSASWELKGHLRKKVFYTAILFHLR